MRKRIYVAAPISKGDLRQNITKATEAGVRLMGMGYAPLVPQLSCYMGGDTPQVLPAGTTHEEWMETDLPWVSVADAVLRLPGESRGADIECDHAQRLGIPVVYNAFDLEAASRRPALEAEEYAYACVRDWNGNRDDLQGAIASTVERALADRRKEEWSL